MFTRKNTKGFTLIELMVVITIIGILAVGGTSVYTSQLQKARDANRMTDVKAIQAALTQFNGDNNQYPATPSGSDTFTGALIGFLGGKLPRDPKFVQGDPTQCNKDATTVTGCLGTGLSQLATDVSGNTKYNSCFYSINTGTSESTYDSYKVSAAFENQSNITNKSTPDNGCVPGRFEVYAGSGAGKMPIGTRFDMQ